MDSCNTSTISKAGMFLGAFWNLKEIILREFADFYPKDIRPY